HTGHRRSTRQQRGLYNQSLLARWLDAPGLHHPAPWQACLYRSAQTFQYHNNQHPLQRDFGRGSSGNVPEQHQTASLSTSVHTPPKEPDNKMAGSFLIRPLNIRSSVGTGLTPVRPQSSFIRRDRARPCPASSLRKDEFLQQLL